MSNVRFHKMPPALLAKLKSLQHPRAERSPFQSHHAFLVWSDQVVPLLSYDEEAQRSFRHAVADVISMSAIHGIESPMRSINHTFGVLNQAITGLELSISSAVTPSSVRPQVKNQSDDPKSSTQLKAWWGEWGWSVAVVTAVLGLITAAIKLF